MPGNAAGLRWAPSRLRLQPVVAAGGGGQGPEAGRFQKAFTSGRKLNLPDRRVEAQPFFNKPLQALHRLLGLRPGGAIWYCPPCWGLGAL